MSHVSRPPRAGPQAAGDTTEEELIPDARGALPPSEVVERKLGTLLEHRGVGVSNVPVSRRSSRSHDPGPGPASSQARTPEESPSSGTNGAPGLSKAP